MEMNKWVETLSNYKSFKLFLNQKAGEKKRFNYFYRCMRGELSEFFSLSFLFQNTLFQAAGILFSVPYQTFCAAWLARLDIPTSILCFIFQKNELQTSVGRSRLLTVLTNFPTLVSDCVFLAQSLCLHHSRWKDHCSFWCSVQQRGIFKKY